MPIERRLKRRVKGRTKRSMKGRRNRMIKTKRIRWMSAAVALKKTTGSCLTIP